MPAIAAAFSRFRRGVASRRIGGPAAPLVRRSLCRHSAAMPESVIDVSALTKRFGDVAAVDAISFSVPRGATVALLGGNGAGKTTTISMLLGLLLPTSGTVAVLGFDMRRSR